VSNAGIDLAINYLFPSDKFKYWEHTS